MEVMFKSSPESHRYVACVAVMGCSSSDQPGESLQMFALFIEDHITHGYLESSPLCNNFVFITSNCFTFNER